MDYKKIAEKLDIFIITYNRAEFLDNTLKQLLAEESPIKNATIKILDNNSTDNTALIVQKYQQNNPNLKYYKNKYNIGGNANITKAFYKAEKEYVWILADNDDYCWDSWQEVENAIEDEADAIVVATYECPKYDIAQLFIQTTFLPGVIYKRSNIDDTVMGNMEFNICNLFPHLALSSKLINENKNIYIVDKAIVQMGSNLDKNGKYTYTRGYNDSIHPLQASTNWLAGYANSLHMIKNPKIRNYIITHNRFCSSLTSAQFFFWHPTEARKDLYAYLCVFNLLPWIYKIKFLIDGLLSLTLYRIIFIYKQEYFSKDNKQFITRYKIKLLNTMNTKLFEIKKNIKGGC